VKKERGELLKAQLKSEKSLLGMRRGSRGATAAQHLRRWSAGAMEGTCEEQSCSLKKSPRPGEQILNLH